MPSCPLVETRDKYQPGLKVVLHIGAATDRKHIMEKKESLVRLLDVYTLCDQFASGLDTACRKGCALCCTTNVTMTTLEGEAILNHWSALGQAPPMALLRQTARRPRFQPVLTINHLAALCAAGQAFADEAADPHAGPCPLLLNDFCSIYAVRPLGCRVMLSLTDCKHNGAADMPDIALAASNLFAQFVEGLDAGGSSGNLTDVLLWINEREHINAGTNRQKADLPKGLAANMPIPVLMVPPEHRQHLQPLLQALQRCVTTPLAP